MSAEEIRDVGPSCRTPSHYLDMDAVELVLNQL
jgi:hypothetical protein